MSFEPAFKGHRLTLLSDSQQKVLTNKDLDLPTQQELLAQFRCDEISASVLEAFQDAFKGVRKPIESGSVLDGLGGMMNDWRTTALSACPTDVVHSQRLTGRPAQANSTRTRRGIIKGSTAASDWNSSKRSTRHCRPSSWASSRTYISAVLQHSERIY